jgi:hypothetical protein
VAKPNRIRIPRQRLQPTLRGLPLVVGGMWILNDPFVFGTLLRELFHGSLAARLLLD